MTALQDFRLYSEFTQSRVSQSGRVVGGGVYWKLYAIENLLRVIIDSILSVGYPDPKWWLYVLSKKKLERIEDMRKQHADLPWESSRGTHVLYYLNLSDLGDIFRIALPYLSPPIAGIDDWIVEIASIQQPRHVVAHMNFPTKDDKKRIDDLYTKTVSLVRGLERDTQIKFKAPR